MNILLWVAVSFGVGIWTGARQRKNQKRPPRKSAFDTCSYNLDATPFRQEPLSAPARFKHSRWEDKDALFWGMADMGVVLENKIFLTTPTERDYLVKLEEWFGQYCRISCQVSPGRFLKLPEQDAFSAEERARFFTLFNAMSVDYVLVSRKNNKIVCAIELDDKSHERDERIARDKRLEHLFELAGVPLLRVSVDDMNTEPPVWERRDAVQAKLARL